MEVGHTQTRPHAIHADFIQSDGSASLASVPKDHHFELKAAELDMAASTWGASTLAALQHEDATHFCQGTYHTPRSSFMSAPICMPFQFGLCNDHAHPDRPAMGHNMGTPVHRCDFCLQPGHGSQPTVKLHRPTTGRRKPTYEIPQDLLASWGPGTGCPLKFLALVVGQHHNHCTPMVTPNAWFDQSRAHWRMDQHEAAHPAPPKTRQHASTTPIYIQKPVAQPLRTSDWASRPLETQIQPHHLPWQTTKQSSPITISLITGKCEPEKPGLPRLKTKPAHPLTAGRSHQLSRHVRYLISQPQGPLPTNVATARRAPGKLSTLDLAKARVEAATRMRPANPSFEALYNTLSEEQIQLLNAGVIDLGSMAEAMERRPQTNTSLPTIPAKPKELKRRAAELELKTATLQVHEAKAARLLDAQGKPQRSDHALRTPKYVDWDGIPRFRTSIMADVLYAAGSSGLYRRGTNLTGRYNEAGDLIGDTQVNILFAHCGKVRTVCMSKIFPYRAARVNQPHNMTTAPAPTPDVKGKYTHMYIGTRHTWKPCTHVKIPGLRLGGKGLHKSQMVIKMGNGRIDTRDRIDIFVYEAAGIGLQGKPRPCSSAKRIGRDVPKNNVTYNNTIIT